MKRVFFFLLIPIFSAQSWAQSSHCLANRYAQDALFDSTDIQITTDVHYATSMRWPGSQMDSLRMDVYQPNPNIDSLDKRPLILMVHGGAFLVGEKDDMAYFCMEMARRGFVTATISYRLGWDCPATDFAQVCGGCQPQASKFRVAMYRGAQDTKAALRYITAFADDYGIDTSAVFLQGESAGSINSLHAGFLQQSEVGAWCPDCVDEVGLLDTTGNGFGITPNIKGIVNSCGGVGLLDMVDAEDDLPTISFHDDNDIVVPFGYGSFVNCLVGGNGSNSVRVRLTENGTCNELNKIEYLPWPIGPLPQHCAYPRNAIIGKASCFLKNLLCDNCSTNINTLIWNIPDCSDGGLIGIEQQTEKEWLELNGNQLKVSPNISVENVEVYDVSMRLLTTISDNSSTIELPSHLKGCMFVKVDANNSQTKVLKWCNF